MLHSAGIGKGREDETKDRQSHLDIMALHGVGGYMDDNKKVFCTKAGGRIWARRLA